MVSRRQFLTTGAAAAAAGAGLPSVNLLDALARDAATSPSPDLTTWPAVRALFPLSRDYLHFASFYFVSHPKPVQEAIDGFRRTIDREPFLVVEGRMFSSPTDNLQLTIRDGLSGYLGVKRDDIAITGNTTTGLALVYAGLRVGAGDEILSTTHDHYSHQESIRFAAEKSGASVRRIALYDKAAEANEAQIVDRVRAAIRPETRALGVTWVHSGTGVRLPVRAIADVVQEANRGRDEAHRVLLIVDGVHGLGAVEDVAAQLGADFFCAGTHKWMFAPRGTGVIVGRSESWPRLRQTIPNFSNLEGFDAWLKGDTTPRATNAYDMTPGGFHAYEHQWAMTAAFTLHETIGRKRIAERIRALNDQCKSGLAAMKHVTLHTPRAAALSAGIICFEVDGVAPDEVVKRLLDRRIVASTTPYHTTYARLAPSLMNDPGEVDAALRAVRTIAGA
jgi:isopenicillin-N epimerase